MNKHNFILTLQLVFNLLKHEKLPFLPPKWACFSHLRCLNPSWTSLLRPCSDLLPCPPKVLGVLKVGSASVRERGRPCLSLGLLLSVYLARFPSWVRAGVRVWWDCLLPNWSDSSGTVPFLETWRPITIFVIGGKMIELARRMRTFRKPFGDRWV